MGLAKKSKLKRTKYERKRVARKRQDRHAASPVSDSEHSNNSTCESAWHVMKEDNAVVLTKLAFHDAATATQPSSVSHSIRLQDHKIPQLTVRGYLVDVQKCEAIQKSGVDFALLDSSCESAVKSIIDDLDICKGNPDTSLVGMFRNKKRHFITNSGKATAYLDTHSPMLDEGKYVSSTIRSVGCQFLVQKGKIRCRFCQANRRSLLTALRQWKKNSATASKFTKNAVLLTPQWKSKLSTLASIKKNSDRNIRRLQKRIDDEIKNDGISVLSGFHGDMEVISKEASIEVEKNCPPGSFRRLLWDQQMKALQSKSPNGMRWHPLIIRWALNIRFKSSAAYHALRSSGFLQLPSERTLRDYSSFFRRQVGFQPELNALLVQEANLTTSSSVDRHVILIFDEMHIREDLVFDKHSQEITGFVDLGDVNNQILKLEKSLLSGKTSTMPSVASQMLVFMVRGLTSSLRFPYAHFPSAGVTAVNLIDIVWEAVEQLEMCGFAVLGICCDGASSNRKFFRIHGRANGVGDLNPTFKVKNPYTKEDRNIYFLSDACHLIKTTRNCLHQSFASSGSRRMHLNGKLIAWSHIQELYRKSQETFSSFGLSVLRKLKFEHLELTSFSKMRVDLAAQVLSTSVANGLEYYKVKDSEETVRFCRVFDKVFDCLNVRGLTNVKENRRGHGSADDDRIKWLEEEFLGYLKEWDNSVESLPNLSKGDRAKLKLSAETIEGWRIIGVVNITL
ncbi:uncharacterized protein [Oscarella lobularis]|uniref:uncharacterized protein isoform X2 n=1 Tax=Oscarella lobularis TaxID=121494 RepID=UPI0033141B3A